MAGQAASFRYKGWITSVEAIRKANRAGATIASFGNMLPLPEQHRGKAVITGVLVAYQKPGEKFGSQAVFVDSSDSKRYVFNIPPEYRGERDSIIAIKHARVDRLLFTSTPSLLNDAFKRVVSRNPYETSFFSQADLEQLEKSGKAERDGYVAVRNGASVDVFEKGGQPSFSLKKDGKDIQIIIPDPSKMACLADFPAKNGWYLLDSMGFSIPIGKGVSPNGDPQAARLQRSPRAHIGLQSVWHDTETVLRPTGEYYLGNETLYPDSIPHWDICLMVPPSDHQKAIFDMSTAKPSQFFERLANGLSFNRLPEYWSQG
ncbi:MAG: hypothetical protein WC588_04230 [Candidatus Micrarchaeia archaeon]